MDTGLDVFLLGAGASNGSLDCTPALPPLGTELYDRLIERPAFRKLLPPSFVPDRQSFEATLSKLWDEHADRMIPVLCEVALYFAEFRPGPGNLYAELGRPLPLRRHPPRARRHDLETARLGELSADARRNQRVRRIAPSSGGAIRT